MMSAEQSTDPELNPLLHQALMELHIALAQLRASKSLTTEEAKLTTAASMAACELRGLLHGAGLARPAQPRQGLILVGAG